MTHANLFATVLSIFKQATDGGVFTADMQARYLAALEAGPKISYADAQYLKDFFQDMVGMSMLRAAVSIADEAKRRGLEREHEMKVATVKEEQSYLVALGANYPV